MMSEIPRPPDPRNVAETLNRKNQEKLREESSGLRLRLLLKDKKFLDPEIYCAKEDVEGIEDFEKRDYTYYENTSLTDRERYWRKRNRERAKKQEKPLAFDDQYNEWSGMLVDGINKKRNNTEWNKVFNPIFEEMNIGRVQDAEFSHDNAQKLYDRYFPKGEKDPNRKGVKQFVRDVLAAYTKKDNEKPDSEDFNRLRKDLPKLQQFAVNFGEDGADKMVEQLLFAEVEHIVDPERTIDINKINATNNYGNNEKEILRDIKDANDLPMLKYRKDIREQLRDPNQDAILIIGETGCGKTIITPQFIVEEMQPGEYFYVTEPRQVNAQSLAKTVSAEVDERFRDTIGFHHGKSQKEDRRGKSTIFSTERILINKLLSYDPKKGDKIIDNLAYVMVDEIHVQSIDTEELLVLLKKVQQQKEEKIEEERKNGIVKTKPLKIIAASATVDKERLMEYFDADHVMKVAGVAHPVKDIYSDNLSAYLGKDFAKHNTKEIEVPEMPEVVADIVCAIDKNIERDKDEEDTIWESGDVLIFAAGPEDIRKIRKALEAQGLENENSTIEEFTAQTHEDKKEELKKKDSKGRRRITVATNVAETGLTFPNLKYVINTGQEFETTIHEESGFGHMPKHEQAKAGANQRRGRVGRISRGVCISLFSRQNFDKRPEYPTPEIKRADLANLMLDMKKLGFITIQQLPKFLSHDIPVERFQSAEQSLKSLNVLNADGSLNEIGKRMTGLPIGDIHLAWMIAAAEAKGVGVEQACAIAVFSDPEGRSIFDYRPDKTKSLEYNVKAKEEASVKAKQTRDQYAGIKSDFLMYLKIWEEWENRTEADSKWAEDRGIDLKIFLKKEAEIKRIMRNATKKTDALSEVELKQLILDAYKDRIVTRPENRRSYAFEAEGGKNRKSSGISLYIDDSSTLKDGLPPKIIVGKIDLKEGRNGQQFARLSNCQVVESM